MSSSHLSDVWSNPAITRPEDVLLLLAIADDCGPDGECFPSNERLAAKSRIPPEDVPKRLEELVAAGYLRVAPDAPPYRETALILTPRALGE